MTEPTDLVAVFKDGDKFPVDEDTKRRIELVDRAAVRRVLDELESRTDDIVWHPEPREALEDFIREMRPEGLE